MIEQWFTKEVRQHLDEHHRLVITDTKNEGAFLLALLPPRMKITLITANNRKEELQARIDAERDDPERNIIFYTSIPKRKLTQLQEYATTCGCIILDDLESYIKSMLFRELGIHSMVEGRSLILAAKMDKGKDENWWRGIDQGIINPLKADEMILSFLKSPDEYKQNTDEDVFHLMAEEACRMVGKPNTNQAPKVFAKEWMKALFEKLLINNVSDELLNLYYTMVDSNEMAESLQEYIDGYTIPSTAYPFKCHQDHPFIAMDAMLFQMMSNTMKAGEPLNMVEEYIWRRLSSAKAKQYKATWLKDVQTLLKFDLGKPHLISSLDDFAEYYKETFAPLDAVMRRLYVVWLNEPDVLRPVQEFYEQRNRAMLDVWYQFIGNYEQTQQGLIGKMFNESLGRTAVIVCDGLRLEMAEAIAKGKFSSGITITRNTAWSKLPSVTTNGMSALYGLASPKMDNVNKRHETLKAELPEVEIMQLTQLNSHVTAEKLLLLYGNIDNIGEKLQLAGLAEINGYEQYLYDAVQTLLRMGYAHVWLTTDHGFVITGILDEADKVDVPTGGTADERFVVSADRIASTSLVERSDDWLTGNYQYYAKTDKPFRTRGAYGYAHGGLTPQECLIPQYLFSQKDSQMGMRVTIVNKKDLKSVTGQFYNVCLKGIGDDGNMFESERRVQLLFYNEQGQEISRSNIIKVKANTESVQEYAISATKTKLVVVDAMTTEQLDTCDIEKSSSRDLDGLF